MSDLNQLVIEKSIEHWPILMAVFMMMAAQWRWFIPNAVKTSLENGGGDAIRKVVGQELRAQDDRIDKKLEDQDERISKQIEDHVEGDREKLLASIAKQEELSKAALQNIVLELRKDIDLNSLRTSKELETLNQKIDYVEKKLRSYKTQTSSTLKAIVDKKKSSSPGIASKTQSSPGSIQVPEQEDDRTFQVRKEHNGALTWEPPPYDSEPDLEAINPEFRAEFKKDPKKE